MFNQPNPFSAQQNSTLTQPNTTAQTSSIPSTVNQNVNNFTNTVQPSNNPFTNTNQTAPTSISSNATNPFLNTTTTAPFNTASAVNTLPQEPVSIFQPVSGVQKVGGEKITSVTSKEPVVSNLPPKEEQAEVVKENKESTNVSDVSVNKTSIFGENSKLTNTQKNTSFVQMSIYEIIQEQTRKLEENIADFNSKAKEIYEEDEKLLDSLNNYQVLYDLLEKEEIRLSELEENVDFFENLLDDYSKKIVQNNDDDELIVCIKEFEKVSDEFYRNVEENKDKDDEILGLVKENYNLCALVDKKLDLYERHL